jgi:hypothetical protein
MERGRFGVSILAILKDEARNMEEWLCHHRPGSASARVGA